MPLAPGVRLLVALLAGWSCCGVLVSGAQSAGPIAACATASIYPGDGAEKTAIAGWLAAAARSRALPPELPVMASLVESGLTNAQGKAGDSAGFFQMRVGIWNTGEYAGYPGKPELQAKWFIDQALAVRRRRVAGGDAQFGEHPARWGEWIADVERPRQRLRSRYGPAR